MFCSSRKVSIIGLGKVGITTAYAMLIKHCADHLVLISQSVDKVEGEKLDLEHGLPFLDHCEITATSDYSMVQGSDVIVITAGAAQKPGQNRIDLLQENKQIMAEIGQKIAPYVQESVVVVVSNPVDILTYQLAQILSLPKGRVLGTGTMLDTARFRFHLAQPLHLNPQSIHSYILGEHGETAFPSLEFATIGGQPLSKYPGYSKELADQSFQQTKDAAAKIIQAKGATYYAIGVVTNQLVKTILNDRHSVLPVSTPVFDYYGESNVALSVPCIIGRKGVEQVLQVGLSESEQQQFKHSAETLRSHL